MLLASCYQSQIYLNFGVTEVRSDDLGISSPAWPVFRGMAVHSARIWKCDLKWGFVKSSRATVIESIRPDTTLHPCCEAQMKKAHRLCTKKKK